MIKYLGSKKRLVPTLGAMAAAAGATTALDLFTGTTRVAQEFKRRGINVTAVDTASYSKVLADTFIATDATSIDKDDLVAAIDELNALPGVDGYVTEVFCNESRFFQPKNGRRIDAIRDHLETHYASSALYPVLLTSLMLAADRVDSTTGLQMAYLKQWAPRSFNDLELRVPDLLVGPGTAVEGRAEDVVGELPHVDLAYLDPPYNQHRYYTNYHVWETLVRWDKPEHYGIACKRVDSRDDDTKSAFNSRKTMPAMLQSVVEAVQADTIVLSYNNESWVSAEDLMQWCAAGRERVELLEFDSKRYVGAQIGIYNPSGDKVGRVSHLRNLEYVVVAGTDEVVRAALAVNPGRQETLL